MTHSARQFLVEGSKRGVYYVLQIKLSGVTPKNRARESDRNKIPGLYRMQGIVSVYSICDNVQLQWGYGATENCASKRSNARLEEKKMQFDRWLCRCYPAIHVRVAFLKKTTPHRSRGRNSFTGLFINACT